MVVVEGTHTTSQVGGHVSHSKLQTNQSFRIGVSHIMARVVKMLFLFSFLAFAAQTRQVSRSPMAKLGARAEAQSMSLHRSSMQRFRSMLSSSKSALIIGDKWSCSAESNQIASRFKKEPWATNIGLPIFPWTLISATQSWSGYLKTPTT